MLGLPDEVLLLICSLLSTEDKLSVRNSCRRLRDIASDPSLWHAVALSYRGPPDDPRLKSCLTLSVPHARKFALTAESVFKCATSKFLPLLQQSPSVTSVSLHGYEITQVQLDAIVSALPRLMDLKVQLSFKSESEVMAALECTCRLQSLVVSCHIPHSDYDFEAEQIVRLWSSTASYKPPELGIQLLGSYYHPTKVLRAVDCCVWQDFFRMDIANLPPTRHEARLLVYQSPSAFTRLSDHLMMQVEFRPSHPPVTPRIEQSRFPDPLFVTICLSGNRIGSCDYLTGAVCNLGLNERQPTFLSPTCITSSLTHLLLDGTDNLTSSSLEVFAKHCPKLIRLSLSDCRGVFTDSLQGLADIAACCPRLEDLNLYGIHHSSVKCVDSLLEILCQMHLIRLVVHACILGSQAARRSNTSTSNASLPAPHATAQAESGLTSLTALEVPLHPHSHCGGCCSSDVVSEVVMRSMLTSLEYIRLSHSLVHGLLECVQHLKYLYIFSEEMALFLPSSIMWYSCLEQVYIKCTEITLTEDDITAITSGGKITHAILLLLSIEKKSIRRFMHNSPRLVLFAIWTDIKMTEECVKELSMEAESHGVVVFKYDTFEYDTSRDNRLLSLYPTKLLSIFTGHSVYD